MIYTPIIIPTLNRDVHLKRCIMSLQRNKWAYMTELYVSLDYPPTEKYMEGYQKVREFLEAGITGFQKVHIYFQEKNLGVRGNTDFLVDRIVEAGYHQYIYSEDDNEFSANFIEYMDKNLCYFEKDDRVLGICAAQDNAAWHANGGNIILQSICPAYGLGVWIEKDEKIIRKLNSGFIDEIGKEPQIMRKIRKRSDICFRLYMSNIVFDRENIFWNGDEIAYCDTIRTMYATATDSFFVAPLISKSRNWGYDGSGVNMGQESWNPEERYKLDDAQDYEIQLPEPLQVDERNTKIHNRILHVGMKKYIIASIMYLLYLFYGRDYKKCIAFKKKLLRNIV